ncbi:extracellular solute-binding protein [Salmonella enterica]|nr:extracellular solute-binding protein [Salmonella enterica]
MKKITMMLAGSLLLSTQVTAAEPASQPWEEVVAQAKKEGAVTFNVWYLQPQWRSVVHKFEQQYGIKVRVPEGTMDGNMNKLLAEARKEQGKIDVIALSVDQLPILKGANALANIDTLPGYQDAYHKIQNVDTQGYAMVFWGNQTGFAYDPQQMGDKPLPQTIEQLTQFITQNPQRFGYNDPNNGGAGSAFIQRVLTLQGGAFDSESKTVSQDVIKSWQKGWDWFSRNENNITRTASGADSLTRLNDGELMLTPAWEDHMKGLQNAGAITKRIKFYVPEFGMPGGGNIVSVAANSPHPAASRVFLNWLVQEDTQKELAAVFGSTPMNKKIPIENNKKSENVQFYGKEYGAEMKKEFVSHVMLK